MVAEGRVPAARVVEAFDELDDRLAGLVVSLERRAADQLALECGEEALTHGVVVAVADGSHRRPDSRFPASPAELDRGVLAALIGMMDHCRGRSLHDGHVERRRDERCPQVCCDSPTHDLAAPHVEHDGQIEEAHPRRNVRDVSDPQRIGPIGHELSVDQVGSRSRRAVTPRRYGPFPPAHSCQAAVLHQSSYALASDPSSFFTQLRVNARRSVRLARLVIDRPYPLLKLFVLSFSRRHHPPAPRVVPAGGDFQHSAHRPDREQGLVRIYEEEDLFDVFSVSPANQAAAFFRISRSS